ncbi:hypothetical protein HMPREF9137_0721 [Prevotella denticola F0289]|nr:hypothetical protein HMPREF9137_0721 [Prevotella denticola F0289]
MPTDVYIWILYVSFGTAGDRHFHIDVGFCVARSNCDGQ